MLNLSYGTLRKTVFWSVSFQKELLCIAASRSNLSCQAVQYTIQFKFYRTFLFFSSLVYLLHIKFTWFLPVFCQNMRKVWFFLFDGWFPFFLLQDYILFRDQILRFRLLTKQTDIFAVLLCMVIVLGKWSLSYTFCCIPLVDIWHIRTTYSKMYLTLVVG